VIRREGGSAVREAAVAALALLVFSGVASAQTKEFSRTVELDSGGTLRVVGERGSMRITGWDESRVQIKARIEPPDDVDADYAKRAVDAMRIEVTGGRSSVAVVPDYTEVPTLSGRGRWRDRREPAVHYEIRAPRKIALNIDSDRGPVTVSGFDGTFDFVVDRGELDLRDLTGDLRIEIDRGDESRMTGVRGSLQLDADRTNLEIDAHALDRDSRIEIDRGDVELRVPGEQRLTVRTEISRRGDFRTDFPVQWSSSDPRKSEGRINGGGAQLFVESDRATIELRRRPD
jgi:hypothetical protein